MAESLLSHSCRGVSQNGGLSGERYRQSRGHCGTWTELWEGTEGLEPQEVLAEDGPTMAQKVGLSWPLQQ